MSKADNMFKELGYKKSMLNNGDIRYSKGEMGFYFDLRDKTFSKGFICDREEINILELQAINKKVKELGWLDE